ncbi:MAG TPA: hypothetical protein VK162_02405 [Streptosporangiaceae bacterium]|nr:hypothetical protein [Streptosporangiaceae bacterium]
MPRRGGYFPVRATRPGQVAAKTAAVAAALTPDECDRLQSIGRPAS